MVFAVRTPARRRRAAVLPAVLIALVLAACTPPWSSEGTPQQSDAARPSGSATAVPSPSRPDPAADPAYAAFYGQKLAWKDCEDGFECATATVPLNWDTPAGETITLALARSAASGKKIGSLFLNPGGPGVSGIDYLRNALGEFPREVRKAYDITSWDSRGVGDSRPAITCLPNAALDDFYALDGSPDTPAEVTALTEGWAEYIAACQKNTGELLAHIDTISTVKDLDVLRALVGDERFNYLGASYGTFYGAWYAELFPWRVGRMVLDGAIDPSLDASEYATGQAKGFSGAVQAFVDDCLTRAECPLRGSREDAYAQLDRLLARVDADPLPTESRPLTQALLITGLTEGMYSQQLWPAVTRALTEAMSGDGSTMLLLADSYMQRDVDGSYDQLLQAFFAISCLDSGETRTLKQIEAAAAEMKADYPLLGDTFGWAGINCLGWPHKDPVPQQKTTAPGAAPILVIGTTNDPATPYEWATALAEQLSSGHLVTRQGEGHTGYGQGSACTDKAVNAYLLRGTVPAKGLTCS